MSFNFSDDDDDDDLDLDAFDDTGLLALVSRERVAGKNEKPSADAPSVAAAASASPPAAASASGGKADANKAEDGGFDEESDGGDWDNIDWEDADDQDDDDEGEDDDNSMQKFPTQPIMINFGKTAGKSNTPDEGRPGENKHGEKKEEDERGEKPSSLKKRKRKTTRVLRSVPHETKQMVLNVRRSEMLCHVVHCMQCSYTCGGTNTGESHDERLLLSHVAYSLIPQEFHAKDNTTADDDSSSKGKSSIIPTKQQLQNFSQWFFQFVNQAGDRRRSAMERNVAQGAVSSRSPPSSTRRRSRRQSDRTKQPAKKQISQSTKEMQGPKTDTDALDTTTHSNMNLSPSNLLQTLLHLSPYYDEDPQLLDEEGIDAIDVVERISAQEKVLLFLAMVGALGWRARYVTSLSPMPLELTVDHPMFASTPEFKSHRRQSSESLDSKPRAKRNKTDEFDKLHELLRLIHENGMLKNGGAKRSGLKRKKRNSKKAKTAAVVDTIDLVSSGEEAGASGQKDNLSEASKIPTTSTSPEDPNNSSLTWVEVLCCNGASKQKISMTMSAKSKSVAMWVPIHPEQESIDKPEEVEYILAWMEMNNNQQSEGGNTRKGKFGSKAKWSSKRLTRRHANTYAKKTPVSYVLAVEHSALKPSTLSDDNRSQLHGVRFADVTPRYANTWSRTLRLRGATGREITSGGGKCVDKWWETSLKQMNRHCKPARHQDKRKSPSKSPARSVTKRKTSAGKEVDVLELESSEDDENNNIQPPDDSDSDEHDHMEAKELTGSIENETIPTSKAAFKQSPFYVIPSVLNSQDVLHPDACKRICGVFKGELVYRRSDASKAKRAKKWLYQGRKVKESELDNPVKQVKARKKPAIKGFQPLTSYGVSEEAQEEMISSMKKKAGEDNGMDNLYGIWQTDSWSPPYVGPNDAIPTNDFKNVELALINPGLTHMDQVRLAPIARKLGIPYAPCMLGYDGHGGNRTATIRGIVVHDHNVALLREASIEWENHAAEKERQERRNVILKRWKRLVVGVMTKDRLDREYG